MVAMTVKRTNLSDTEVKLSISADQAFLERTKAHVLRDVAPKVQVAGFRKGKVPLPVVEKNVDPNMLATEFLDHAVNEMYGKALDQENLRPVANPKIELKKFVPYTTVEFEASVEVVGDITLGDYKKIKLARVQAQIDTTEVDGVIKQLRARAATREKVERAAQKGDEVVIDFSGIDAKNKKPIAGADGKGYPLTIGSDSFIPGFEDNLIGLKPSDSKHFTLTFPKDYGVSALQNKKVTFDVTVQSVHELQEPKLDDAFAASVGPVKTVAELKKDIRTQLQAEKQTQLDRDYENELVQKIAEKSTVAIPKVLVDEQIEAAENEERRNLAYRGQTWEEHLKEEGQTAEEHKEAKRPVAEERVKMGLILSKIAEEEKIVVSDDEINAQLDMIRRQYGSDAAMAEQIDTPETRRNVTARLLTDKTVKKLVEYASSR